MGVFTAIALAIAIVEVLYIVLNIVAFAAIRFVDKNAFEFIKEEIIGGPRRTKMEIIKTDQLGRAGADVSEQIGYKRGYMQGVEDTLQRVSGWADEEALNHTKEELLNRFFGGTTAEGDSV